MSEEDPKSWVYVGGLPFELSEGDIVCVFSQYGEIFEISLARDKDTGKSRGFCFIKYEDLKSCELAVDNLNGAAIVGRKIRVSYPSNLNFVKARKPAIVAPTENSTLPEVLPEKRKPEDSGDDERAAKSFKYYEGDEPKRLLPLRHDDDVSPVRKAIEYKRGEEKDRRSPEYRSERRDRRSPRHGDEDRERISSRHRHDHRSERSSRHRDEDRPRKSAKHSHRDKERRSPRYSDKDRDRKSSRSHHSSRDERKSHKSSRHKDEDRSPRHRDKHKESSSRHR